MHGKRIALMQMVKNSSCVNELRKANLQYIVKIKELTYGGTTASFASLGDVLIAPKAFSFSGKV